MDKQYDTLKLSHQLCFPLYAASKEVVKRYKPFLDELDLTYTQYIAMMVLWEHPTISAKDMGEQLFLDSGTLTPVLKSLEAKGYVVRRRSDEDERVLMCSLTPTGLALRDKATSVPPRIAACIHLLPEEGIALYSLLYKILGK